MAVAMSSPADALPEKKGRVWSLLDDQTNLLDELEAVLNSLHRRVADISLVKEEAEDIRQPEPVPTMSTLATRIEDHNHTMRRHLDRLQVMTTQLEV